MSRIFLRPFTVGYTKEENIIHTENFRGFAVTQDSLFNGRLTCMQHRAGYRFSVDSVILAHFITPEPKDTILDLGAGSGILSLIMD